MVSGVLAILNGMKDNRAYYTFGGDLCQMGIIKRELQEAGFLVVQNDVYPGFPKDQEDEYKKALAYIFKKRIEGWWSQKEALVKYGICTQEEFRKALG